MFNGGYGTPASAGWAPLWMGGSKAATPCSRPSSCCRGRSRRRGRPKSTCRSCNIICGWWRHAPRGRQMGRDPRPCRSALSASDRHGGAQVLALCESGEQPQLFGVEPPKPRLEAVRIVDMTSSNAWAEFAGIFARTRSAYLEHEQARAELKSLMPEDAKEAIGHGVRAKRSKSNAISFEVMEAETRHAAFQ